MLLASGMTTYARAGTNVTTEQIKPHLEKAVFGFGIINPITALPQLHNIWFQHQISGLSIVTIGAALIMSILWTAYGATSRQTVLWVTSAAWVAMNGATLLGVAVLS